MFIELHTKDGSIGCINVSSIYRFQPNPKGGIILQFMNEPDLFSFKEAYDDIVKALNHKDQLVTCPS